MRRSASRKTGQPNSTPSLNSSPADLFRSASSKATTKELERIDALYYSYANGSSAMIDPEGIEALCSDMEVDHTDVRILMLAWFHPFVKTDDYTYQENESRKARIF